MNKPRVKKSSGNVFHDLGFENAPEELAKADIAARLCEIIKAKRLTQVNAAKLLRIDQPKVSALIHGRLEGFSIERLFRFLNALDRDIQIVIKKKPASRDESEITVLAA